MNLSDRNTRLKAIAVGALFLAVFFLLILRPWTAKWSELGEQLEPKQAQIDQIRERVEGRESLVAKRDALARRMGSLLGRPAAAKQEATKPEAAKPEAAKSADAKPADVKPADAKDTPPAAEVKKPAEEVKADAPPPTGSESKPAEAKVPPSAESVASAPKEGAADAPKKDAAKPDGKPKDSGPSDAAGDRRLAAYVDQAAGQSGVKIKRVSVKKSSGGPRAKAFVPVALQLSVEGNAESMLKFFHQLEQGDRFARIDQFELHRDASKGGSVEASLDVLGYQE